MANLIDPGKEYRTFLETIKKPTDEPTIRQSYSASGLMDRLGTWRGTTQQYNALLTLGKAEQTLAGIQTKTAALGTMVTQALKAKEAGVPITPKTQFAPTKEFAEAYPDLAKQELGEQAIRLSPTGVVETLTPTGEWKSYQEQIAAEKAVAGKPFVPFVPEEPPTETKELTPVEETTGEVNVGDVQLASTDIGDIINEAEQGTLTSPEMVLGQERAALLTEDEKARASQALTTIQQQMASKGLAFSGIRTATEEASAAESLRRLSGISLDLAGRIISAARQEQTRRIQAIQFQQTAQNTALRAMGYVIDPTTGKLAKTIERERLEAPAAPRYFSSQGSYFSFDPTTGELSQLYQAPEQERNLRINFFTDSKGNVTKIVSDPLTGQEISREELGILGKPITYYSMMLQSGYDPTNPEDIQRWQEDWGIIPSETQSPEDSSFFQDVSDFLGGVLK